MKARSPKTNSAHPFESHAGPSLSPMQDPVWHPCETQMYYMQDRTSKTTKSTLTIEFGISKCIPTFRTDVNRSRRQLWNQCVLARLRNVFVCAYCPGEVAPRMSRWLSSRWTGGCRNVNSEFSESSVCGRKHGFGWDVPFGISGAGKPSPIHLTVR